MQQSGDTISSKASDHPLDLSLERKRKLHDDTNQPHDFKEKLFSCPDAVPTVFTTKPQDIFNIPLPPELAQGTLSKGNRRLLKAASKRFEFSQRLPFLWNEPSAFQHKYHLYSLTPKLRSDWRYSQSSNKETCKSDLFDHLSTKHTAMAAKKGEMSDPSEMCAVKVEPLDISDMPDGIDFNLSGNYTDSFTQPILSETCKTEYGAIASLGVEGGQTIYPDSSTTDSDLGSSFSGQDHSKHEVATDALPDSFLSSSTQPLLCQVCGDQAAGFYCGAYICEACKKFFIRASKLKQPKYVCLRQKNCVVTKESRVHCQYCRYQKCLSLQMYYLKDGQKGEDKRKVQEIPCRVCSAPSSGFHFGALTCEGCKGFFRRMVNEREPNTYKCSKGGGCEVTTMTRNICKACRYAKCIQIGMCIEGSRIGRQPNAVKHAISMEVEKQAAKKESRQDPRRSVDKIGGPSDTAGTKFGHWGCQALDACPSMEVEKQLSLSSLAGDHTVPRDGPMLSKATKPSKCKEPSKMDGKAPADNSRINHQVVHDHRQQVQKGLNRHSREKPLPAFATRASESHSSKSTHSQLPTKPFPMQREQESPQLPTQPFPMQREQESPQPNAFFYDPQIWDRKSPQHIPRTFQRTCYHASPSYDPPDSTTQVHRTLSADRALFGRPGYSSYRGDHQGINNPTSSIWRSNSVSARARTPQVSPSPPRTYQSPPEWSIAPQKEQNQVARSSSNEQIDQGNFTIPFPSPNSCGDKATSWHESIRLDTGNHYNNFDFRTNQMSVQCPYDHHQQSQIYDSREQTQSPYFPPHHQQLTSHNIGHDFHSKAQPGTPQYIGYNSRVTMTPGQRSPSFTSQREHANEFPSRNDQNYQTNHFDSTNDGVNSQCNFSPQLQVQYTGFQHIRANHQEVTNKQNVLQGSNSTPYHSSSPSPFQSRDKFEARQQSPSPDHKKERKDYGKGATTACQAGEIADVQGISNTSQVYMNPPSDLGLQSVGQQNLPSPCSSGNIRSSPAPESLVTKDCTENLGKRPQSLPSPQQFPNQAANVSTPSTPSSQGVEEGNNSWNFEQKEIDEKMKVAAISLASLSLIEQVKQDIHRPECFETKLKSWEWMMEFFHFHAKKLIQFAKKVPGFRGIFLNDQVKLISNAAYPLVLLNLSRDYEPETGYYNYFNIPKRDRERILEQFPQFSVLHTHFKHCGVLIKELDLSEVEFAYLSSLILLDDECEGLEHPSKVKELKEILLAAFEHYEHYQKCAGDLRFGQILLRLSEFSQFSMQHNVAVMEVFTLHPELHVPPLYAEMYN